MKRSGRARLMLPKAVAVTVIGCGTPAHSGGDAGPFLGDASDRFPDGGLNCLICTLEACPEGECEPLPTGDGGESCQCLS